MPDGITLLRVLAVGGGGGSGSGNNGGGGSGYVKSGVFNVQSGISFEVSVGTGGLGGSTGNDGASRGQTAGGISKFGTLLSASGGLTSGTWFSGGNGGSGGGAGGACDSDSGFAGTDGSDGADCVKHSLIHPSNWGRGGKGQGSLTNQCGIFKRNKFSKAEGGKRGGTISPTSNVIGVPAAGAF